MLSHTRTMRGSRSILYFVTLAAVVGIIVTGITRMRLQNCMIVGRAAPTFSCDAIVDGERTTVSLRDFGTRYKILFFYPADFTFVCPTELRALEDIAGELETRNAVILGISGDTLESHEKWLATPKSEGGVEGITYPLLSDTTHAVARSFNVFDEKEGVCQRGVFIIDGNNTVQAAMITASSVGRSTGEILRLLDAIQKVAEQGEVCPANWRNGDETLEKNAESVKKYFRKK